MKHWMLFLPLIGALVLSAGVAAAADTVNAYSIWPENWARKTWCPISSLRLRLEHPGRRLAPDPVRDLCCWND